MRKLSLLALAGVLYALLVAASSQSELFFDSVQYHAYARNLIETQTYGEEPGVPDMNREPGYGVFLAILAVMFKALGVIANADGLKAPQALFWVKFTQGALMFATAAAAALAAPWPKRLRTALFALFVFSPTVFGTAREIYSEALALPLSFVFVYFAANALKKPSAQYLAGASLAWALAILTKSYLQYTSIFFIAGAAYLLARRRQKALASLLLVTGVVSALANGCWSYRNKVVLGEGVASTRLAIALAGKVARIDQMKLPEELPAALAAAVGSNFCDGLFGAPSCSKFDFRECDRIGPATWARYRRDFPPDSVAEKKLKSDMVALYFEKPVHQLLGSFLEVMRISFFEAVMDTGSLPPPLKTPARAWHAVGSALMWACIALGLLHLRRTWTKTEPHIRAFYVLAALLIGYHYLVMSQITNVVRYVFPVLPFLYVFAATGIARVKHESQSR